MKSIFSRIRKTVQIIGDQLFPMEEGNETIASWQSRFFREIMLVLAPLAFLVCIPGVWLSWKEGLIFLAFADVVGFLVVMLVLFTNRLSMHTRKIILLWNLYFIGLVLLYYLGWTGPGLLYLLALSVFSTLVLSTRSGYLFLLCNILIYMLLALDSAFGITGTQRLLQLSPVAIITVGLNFIVLNLILVYSISSLLRGLQAKITAEKEALELLRVEIELHKNAKDRAEESDRLKSSFLANISHEIRTPMNGILGFTKLLKNPRLTPDKKETYLDIIDKSGQRLLLLIEEIMDISRIESGASMIQTQEIRLKELLDSIYALFEPEAKEKGLLLVLEPIPRGENLVIHSDLDKLYSILTNLIRNAMKFTEKGHITFGYQRLENKHGFFVRDTGIGIDPAKTGSIFDRFYQIEDTIYKNSSGGAGLGLSICKAYVEMLGGEIHVTSTPGEGSEFRFWVPLAANLKT